MPGKRYAEGTTVAVANSKAEIERTIRGYEPDASVLVVDDPHRGRSGIQFRARNRVVQIGFDHPTGRERYITHTDSNRRRPLGQVEDHIQREIRRRWRCVLLTVKNCFEVAQSGISTFDEAFLPYLLCPGGTTVADTVVAQVEQAFETGATVPGLHWAPITNELTTGDSDA